MEMFYNYKKKTDKIITGLFIALSIVVAFELVTFLVYTFSIKDSSLGIFINPFIPFISDLYLFTPIVILCAITCVFLSLLVFYGFLYITKQLDD